MSRARVAALALLLVATAACAAEPSSLVAGAPIPLGEGVEPGAIVGPGLVFRGALDLTSPARAFGGLSGLAIEGGGRLVAISDAGSFVELDLVEDGDEAGGTLRGIAAAQIVPLLREDGTPLRRWQRDSEDLVVLPDGTRLVVFEHGTRLDLYPGRGLAARRLATYPLPGLVPDGNSGIEALARLPTGELLLIAETKGEAAAVREAWIGPGPSGPWSPLRYVPIGNDDVTAAALLPGGDLLVLERSLSIFGLRARLVRVPAGELRPGGRLVGTQLLRLAHPYLADNFEGLAVRDLGHGRAAIYIVSDDNFSGWQRTYLIKLELLP